jgi:uncharacterized alpha-E superfamily protein
MLSRVAGSVYWMFRYLERAQNMARFLNADFSQYLEAQVNEGPYREGNLWHSLLAVTGDQEDFFKTHPAATRDAVAHFLTVDADYGSSILSCVTAARENARSVREIISSEMWEEVNSLYLMVTQFAREWASGPGTKGDPFAFCRAVVHASYLVIGLFYSTMNRGDAWHFGRAGMLLERADKTSRILDVKYFILLPDASLVGSAYDNTQWAALLRSVSGLEMYRKIYRRISPRDVAEFLVFDRNFPRSIAHCLQNTEESLRLLNGPLATVTGLLSDLASTKVEQAMDSGLHEYLDGLQTRMNQVDLDVYQGFFALKLRPARTNDGNLGQHQS